MRIGQRNAVDIHLDAVAAHAADHIARMAVLQIVGAHVHAGFVEDAVVDILGGGALQLFIGDYRLLGLAAALAFDDDRLQFFGLLRRGVVGGKGGGRGKQQGDDLSQMQGLGLRFHGFSPRYGKRCKTISLRFVFSGCLKG